MITRWLTLALLATRLVTTAACDGGGSDPAVDDPAPTLDNLTVDAEGPTVAIDSHSQGEDGGNEPWVFLVGPDGTIQARWDNVLDEAELVEALDGLATQ